MGFEGGKNKIKKVLRVAAAGLMLGGVPAAAAPGGLSAAQAEKGARLFSDQDRLPPRAPIETGPSNGVSNFKTENLQEFYSEFHGHDTYESDLGDSYDYQHKQATEEEKSALKLWYSQNKSTFDALKTRQMSAFQEFLRHMKACGTKSEVPNESALNRRIAEAHQIFENAKSFNELFKHSWNLWLGESPDAEALEDSDGMKTYESSLRFGRNSADAFEKLEREYRDVIPYIFDQSFCATS